MWELFLIAACLVSKCLFMTRPAIVSRENLKEETTRLVNAFRHGDKQAFNRLVELYQTKIYNLALNYVKQTEEAKDLVQDIFVTIYRSLPTLKDDTKFSSWLYQIAINHCRNRYKKLVRQGFFNSSSIDDPESPLYLSGEDSPEKNIELDDMTKLLFETIEKMSQHEKEIILLRDIQELSYEEISSALDIPLGTVKSKLNRARTALKNKFKHLL